MRLIPLSQGKHAIVDDDDWEWLSTRNWFFHAATGYAMGYVSHGRGRSPVTMHRIILGAKRGDYTDHQNHDKLDNRRANIRLCSQSQNMLNADMRRGTPRSRYRGVSFDRRRGTWYAQFRGRWLGSFSTEEAAARAYDHIAAIEEPAFVQLNFGGRR